MEWTIEECGNVTVVTLEMEYLDASNVKAFKSAIKPVLEASSNMVFDLGHLKFVDSAGIGALLTCLRAINASGGDLKLCETTKQVRAIFELIRLHHIFEIFNAKGEALRAFRAAGETLGEGVQR